MGLQGVDLMVRVVGGKLGICEDGWKSTWLTMGGISNYGCEIDNRR